MKLKTYLLYIQFFLIFQTLVVHAQYSNVLNDKKRVAVMTLQNNAKLKDSEINYLSNLLRQAAGRLPRTKYQIMTQDNILILLPPRTTLEECLGTCAIDTGRRLGAHYVMVGEVIIIGSSLRVCLNLYDSQSGELISSDVVKAIDIESLEGLLQGSALSLFSVLDSSLAKSADLLKRGFLFRKYQYSDLPMLPGEVKNFRQRKTIGFSKLDTKLKLKQLHNIDIDSLILYETTIKIDQDPSVKAELKITKWNQVAKSIPQLSQQAYARARTWEEYILKQGHFVKRQYLEAKEKSKIRKLILKKLSELAEADLKIEYQRKREMQTSWSKLNQLLSLKLIDEQDKLDWVEAFVRTFGAISELNPFIRSLDTWTSKIQSFDNLVKESLEDLKLQQQRAHAIQYKIGQAKREEALSQMELKHFATKVKKAQKRVTKVQKEKTLKKQLQACSKFGRCTLNGLMFLKIPSGHFMMGSKNGSLEERPRHLVKVRAFLMTETEVTVDQYQKCVNHGVCSKPLKAKLCTWYSKNKNKAINCINWRQARRFALWAGGDLPTEAQWEYAAQGGEDYIYSGSNLLDKVAWYSENTGSAGVHTVKGKSPNAYGLYDMSGNVWEWVLDEWHHNYKKAPIHAETLWGKPLKCADNECNYGPKWRVLRGGSWDYDSQFLKLTVRSSDRPDIQDNQNGFRIVRVLP